MDSITYIVRKEVLDRDDIIRLLSAKNMDSDVLFKYASLIRDKYIGRRVWFRGLIEFSNICVKDCFYCGIRLSNIIERHDLSENEILAAARFAYENGFGSIVLQSGENQSKKFIERIETLLQKIRDISKGQLGITISLGEQQPETYERWFGAGAHRYLLRIETTNPELYNRLHPSDGQHDFNRRLECLSNLKKQGTKSEQA